MLFEKIINRIVSDIIKTGKLVAKYNPDIHHRQSIRLKGYDYSQEGAYFITICIKTREYIFGKIISNKMQLNDAGRMIDVQWNALPNQFSHLKLDEYVIMPNHVHGIIIVGDQNNIGSTPTRADTRQGRHKTYPYNTKTNLGAIVGTFKSITTRKYIKGINESDWPTFEKRLWQKNYYENIIRDEKSLGIIREYIINNPSEWETDELFSKIII